MEIKIPGEWKLGDVIHLRGTEAMVREVHDRCLRNETTIAEELGLPRGTAVYLVFRDAK